MQISKLKIKIQSLIINLKNVYNNFKILKKPITICFAINFAFFIYFWYKKNNTII